MNKMPNSPPVFSRGMWISTGLLTLIALTFGSLTPIAEVESKSYAFPLQMTTTPAFGPGTTVTPIPGAATPLTGPALYVSVALQAVVLVAVLVGILYFVFNKPGARKGKNLLHVVIGFLAWFIVNTYLWNSVMSGEPGTIFMNPFRIIPLLVTLVALVVSYFARRWITLGLVCAILVNAIALVILPDPSLDVMDPDQTVERVITMVPFYMPFFYPGI